jgi:hypothetical protein
MVSGSDFAPDFWVASIAILVALPPRGALRAGGVSARPITAWWALTLILTIWVLSLERAFVGIREFVAISVAFFIVESLTSVARLRISKKIAAI